MIKLKIPTGYKPYALNKQERQRLHLGIIQFKEALERDYQESLKKPSGLPKDWRNRVFK